MKKILFVTGTRADYGIMHSLLQKLESDPQVDLRIVVTGMHLDPKYGNTYKQILSDGLRIFKKIPLSMDDSSDSGVMHQIATLTSQLSEIFASEKFDLTLILGDRYEMLPVANTSVIFKVPICHIHGGEATLGNYDELIRNAITKMSHLHLPSTEEYRHRIIQMGEDPKRVINIGSMGVENVKNEKVPSLESIFNKIGVRFKKNDYFVMLFHPTTLHRTQGVQQVQNLLQALQGINCVILGTNSDSGSDQIRALIREDVESNVNHCLYQSLATEEFHKLVSESKGLVGNSSSGIIEVPSLGVSTINVGNRQEGRVRGKSVIDVTGDNVDELRNAMRIAPQISDFTNPYEKKNSSNNAWNAIKEFLDNGFSSEKPFYDIKFTV